MARLPIVILFALVAAGALAAGWFLATPPPAPAPPTPSVEAPAPEPEPAPAPEPPGPPLPAPPDTVWRVDVTADDPVQGPADALVTIVLFGDFASVHTARSSSWLAAALAARPDDVRLVWKPAPRAEDSTSVSAARAGVAAQRLGVFWPLHETLIARGGRLAELDVATLAETVARPAEEWSAALAAPETEQRLAALVAQARALEVSATPTLFLNGRKVLGLRSAAELEGYVLEARERALALTRQGISRGAVYWQLMARATR